MSNVMFLNKHFTDRQDEHDNYQYLLSGHLDEGVELEINGCGVYALDDDTWHNVSGIMREMGFRPTHEHTPAGTITSLVSVSFLPMFVEGMYFDNNSNVPEISNNRVRVQKYFAGYPVGIHFNSHIPRVMFGCIDVTVPMFDNAIDINQYWDEGAHGGELITINRFLGTDLPVPHRYMNVEGLDWLSNAQHVVRDEDGNIVLVIIGKSTYFCPLLTPLLYRDEKYIQDVIEMMRLYHFGGIDALNRGNMDTASNKNDVLTVLKDSFEGVGERLLKEKDEQKSEVEICRRNYLQAVRKMDELNNMLAAIKSQNIDVNDMYERIMAISKVREVHADPNSGKLVYVLNDLVITAKDNYRPVGYYHLPSVSIVVNVIDGSITFYRTDDHSIGNVAPHVCDHKACFGSAIDVALSEALRYNDYTLVISLMIQFLEQANVNDLWGSDVIKYTPIDIEQNH